MTPPPNDDPPAGKGPDNPIELPRPATLRAAPPPLPPEALPQDGTGQDGAARDGMRPSGMPAVSAGRTGRRRVAAVETVGRPQIAPQIAPRIPPAPAPHHPPAPSHEPAITPAPPRGPTLRGIVAAVLDFFTIFILAGNLVARLTGGLTEGGFSLEGRPALVFFGLIAAYFILMPRFGGTIWQRILRTGPARRH